MNRPVEQWWTKKQLAVVDDRSINWRLETFRASPATATVVEGARVLGKSSGAADPSATLPDGWDHEHCELCWSKISALSGDSADGYTDGNKWLCISCYSTFIAPRESS